MLVCNRSAYLDIVYQILFYIPDHVLSTVSLLAVSERYRNVKLKGYDLLEEKNREIVRKLNPCPKQYKK